MKKRIIAIVSCAVLGFVLTGCGSSSMNTDVGTEGLTYKQSNGAYYVTGYDGSDVNIIIPDTYNDVEVIGVEDQALVSSDIQSVIFGKNVSYIGERAFGNCSLLKQITFKSQNVEMDEGAFHDAVNLENINFTEDEYEIELHYAVFRSCDSLTEVDLSKALAGSSMDMSAFDFCENLSTLYVPSSITWTDESYNTGNPNISAVNNKFLKCDAEIIYK